MEPLIFSQGGDGTFLCLEDSSILLMLNTTVLLVSFVAPLREGTAWVTFCFWMFCAMKGHLRQGVAGCDLPLPCPCWVWHIQGVEEAREDAPKTYR